MGPPLSAGLCCAASRLDSQALVSVTLLIDDNDAASDASEDELWEPLFELVAGHSQLCELHVSIIVHRRPVRSLIAGALLPLIRCHSMQSFVFGFAYEKASHAVVLGLPVLEPLLTAWPRLYELIICVPTDCNQWLLTPVGVTLELLPVLQARCPLLRILELVLLGSGLLHTDIEVDHGSWLHVRLRVANITPGLARGLVKEVWPSATVYADPLFPLQYGKRWNVVQLKRCSAEMRVISALTTVLM
ncbi:hypothetical protein CALVIDRAFT_569944 [Calocera viscosa TUFC12733]|uniref:Uncharacterized protein n=1 Tax=Calocera viscosa (strain TUFC12733) TaxID=1330018 RepID=A0A167FEI3_CALVF|nr:hypothetical protein CALVIDRAFT_569944 [Calocera viscosa TUFC12733]